MMKKKMMIMVLAAFALVSVMNGPLWAASTDETIVKSLENSYVFKTFLKDDDIEIESKNGVVTLKGTVADSPSKTLAYETAVNMFEVKSVDNKLVVKDESTDETSDSWIYAKVKTMLMSHRNVSAVNTKVTVADGIVTLKGEASSTAQKQLTTDYARDIDGVKDVKNEMTVVETPKTTTQTLSEKIDDASITAQVKTALLFHRGTRVLKTNVSTKNGVVTVAGMAKNAAEKDLVNKLSADVNGVTKVVNVMTIEPEVKK